MSMAPLGLDEVAGETMGKWNVPYEAWGMYRKFWSFYVVFALYCSDEMMSRKWLSGKRGTEGWWSRNIIGVLRRLLRGGNDLPVYTRAIGGELWGSY